MKKMVFLIVLGLVVAGACAPAVDAGGAVGGDGVGGEAVSGEAYVESAELLIMESYPVQVTVHVTGSLPTPCHEFRYQYEIQNFGEVKRVDFMVSSMVDAEAICTQVLEPFETTMPIGLENALEGNYEVYVNGDLVGEFSYPA